VSEDLDDLSVLYRLLAALGVADESGSRVGAVI